MSKKDRKQKLNDVSNSSINIKQIKEYINKNNNTVENDYKDFCNRYTDIDFSKYNIRRLKKLYEIGNELLNQYFITQNTVSDNSIIIQLQHIVNNISYHINLRQLNDISNQTLALTKKLENTISQAEKIKQDSDKRAQDLKHIKNDIKSITTTIISIVLAISIIPTAIAGIEKIAPNYILPFLASVVLFGIIMITFVYSIYQDKLKVSTWITLIIALIICVGMWISSFFINIDINVKTKEKNENVVEKNSIERTD